jgi:hypothetical protein
MTHPRTGTALRLCQYGLRLPYDPLAEHLLDSDTAFFGLSSLMICWSTGIGLLEVDDVNDDTRRWTIAAHRLLGLPTEDGATATLGNMICWKLGDRKRHSRGAA